MRKSDQCVLLAIETSCDETGIAIMQRNGDEMRPLAHAVASQIDIHKETGGVVPNIAAREHVSVLRPLLERVMREANMSREHINAIAVTVGPGLAPALAIGVQAARTLSYVWNVPIVPVHHIEGHVYSALLMSDKDLHDAHDLKANISNALFHALALIVSGGHTMLIEVSDHLRYRILGSTRDDAAGEVFDKVGRMLGLPYPGGPHVSALAQSGDAKKYKFPRPMINSGDHDFSFSGLKTAVYYTIRELSEKKLIEEAAHICAGFQEAVVDSLCSKSSAALRGGEFSVLLLAGGVAANDLLRKKLQRVAQHNNILLRIAPKALCSDNAVMIGQAGIIAYEHGRTVSWRDVDIRARVSIEEYALQTG